MKVKLIIGAALLVPVLILAAQNSTGVTVKFLPWSFPASLALVIFLTGAAGILVGWLLGTALRIKRPT